MDRALLKRLGWIAASMGLTGALVGCSDLAADGDDELSSTTRSSGYLVTCNGLNAVNGLNATNGLNASNGLNATNGLNTANGLGSANGFNTSNGFNGSNGFNTANGYTDQNGLNATNGLNMANGLNSTNGLGSSNGLMTTDGGRQTVSYLVRCALRAGDTLVKQDQNGNNFTFKGAIGLAPEYKTGGCGRDCAEALSSCLMAHVNTSGVHIPLWMTSPMTAIGWGQSPSYPTQEGTFFGQIMLTNTSNNLDAYFCNGPGVASDVVPGRLGFAAGSTKAPYANAYPTSDGKCATSGHCTMQSNGDGALSCKGNGVTWTKPITVWRGQTFQAESGAKSGTAKTVSCSSCGAGARVGGLTSSSKVTFSGVKAATSGANNLVVYYTNGDSSRHWFNIQVNGGASQLIQFDPTGSSSAVAQKPVTLLGFTAGSSNTVAFSANGSDSPPDLDWIEVIGATSDFCDRSRWIVSASSSSVQDPPLNAIDADPQTRWSSGRDMDGSDYFIVDFGGTVKISSISMDLAGYDDDDYPDSYALYASTNGTTFSTSSFTSSSGSVEETKSFSTQTVRAVKIKQTGSNKSHRWSINDLSFDCAM